MGRDYRGRGGSTSDLYGMVQILLIIVSSNDKNLSLEKHGLARQEEKSFGGKKTGDLTSLELFNGILGHFVGVHCVAQ